MHEGGEAMNSRIYYSQEAEQQAKRQQVLIGILFAAFGLTIGAAVALLFAPRSGEQIRHDLTSSLHDSNQGSNDILKKLEREFADFRKSVEDRIHS
jgi:gas vesicle protein